MSSMFRLPASPTSRCDVPVIAGPRRSTFPVAMWICVILLVSGLTGSVPAQGQPSALPRNIIVLIGDGMGPAQLTALRIDHPSTAFNRFRTAGFVVTPSASHFITESAAAATAFATGTRTTAEHVGIAPDGTRLLNLLERARARGARTGVVATSGITHATPAGFLAHVDSRKKYHAIAAQIAESGADVLIGGGLAHFLPKTDGGERQDGRDLLREMASAGYDVHRDPAQLQRLIDAPGRDRKHLVLLANDELPRADQRQYSLSTMTRAALALLDGASNGFVLMIEGSQIDWAGHANDFTRLLAELRDFDGAVAAALDYAERDGSTLVVATADHETGGLTLIGSAPDGSDMSPMWARDDHSAVMTPLFSFGPGAEAFGGIHAIDEVGRLLHRMLGAGN